MWQLSDGDPPGRLTAAAGELGKWGNGASLPRIKCNRSIVAAFVSLCDRALGHASQLSSISASPTLVCKGATLQLRASLLRRTIKF